MKIEEIRKLLDTLEKVTPDINCRLTLPYDEIIEDHLRGAYLITLEDTAWCAAEITISEKL